MELGETRGPKVLRRVIRAIVAHTDLEIHDCKVCYKTIKLILETVIRTVPVSLKIVIIKNKNNIAQSNDLAYNYDLSYNFNCDSFQLTVIKLNRILNNRV